MVIYDSLDILVCWHFSPCGVVSRHSIWIYIDDLAVSFVFEKQALLVLSYDLQQQMKLNDTREQHAATGQHNLCWCRCVASIGTGSDEI